MSRFTYAAHTEKAIFYLDEEGVCQDLEAKGGAPLGADVLRCVGAQYVASLDLADASGLVPLPREGASMLFVVADARMRFSLVRTGVVVRFETLAEGEAATIAPSAEEERREKAIKATLELVAEGDSQPPPPPDVRVAWPSADVIARAMLLPPSSFRLMAPPQPRRAVATG